MQTISKKAMLVVSILAAQFLSANSLAEQLSADPTQQFLDMMKVKLRHSGTTVSSVRETRFTDLYEVSLTNGSTIMVDKKGEYGIVGNRMGAEVFDFQSGTSITQKHKGIDMLNYVSEAEPFLSYKAKNEKDKIFVFADIQCGYCQMLDDSIPELNKIGITVDYFPVPISKNSDLYMNAAYCSSDREATYTQLMNGIRSAKRNVFEQAKANNLSKEEVDIELERATSRIDRLALSAVENPKCEPYDMQKSREKAKALGVVGTPNILFSDGMRVQHAMSVDEIRDVVFKE